MHLKTQPITLNTLTTYYLPIYSEALRLVRIYLEQAPWFFGAVTRRQIEEEMLPLWYEDAAALVSSPSQQASSSPGAQALTTDNSPPRNTSSPPTSPTAGQQHTRTGNSHDLALLFVIFCFGSLTDTNLPSPPDNIPAERFYKLTKVSLSLDPQAGAGKCFCFLLFFFGEVIIISVSSDSQNYRF